ncbi:FMN-linked oxidoreductase [Artomyces pyxidatus]|uniref:FMN-linked oxidoreductase n=1 Tax=Artomyces pyxidatus TaxID=48021 RepID=A0ACB8T543_9AGAM|nr:FMN-linked oxidoreductase [Artomyces pyxidatus]
MASAIHRLSISPPLMNSSCPWASETEQLQELFDSPHTGAVTTRTATLTGFSETEEHTVVFAHDTVSSCNSYGYSPHPLSWYIDCVESIFKNAPEGSRKPFIISITSSSPISLSSMLDAIQQLRARLDDAASPASRIGVELNTSCPNIKGSPPPAYNAAALAPLLDVLAQHFWRDPTLTLGLKLPPYSYSTQLTDLVKAVAALSRPDPAEQAHSANPIAFFTSTNTLGQTLLFGSQTRAGGVDASAYALPTVLGGLAGDALHPLALGNVYSFRQLLDEHEDVAVRAISIVGVGGVTTREAHERMRRAGAKVVACATLLGREGVKAFEMLTLVNEKHDFVEEKGGDQTETD